MTRPLIKFNANHINDRLSSEMVNLQYNLETPLSVEEMDQRLKNATIYAEEVIKNLREFLIECRIYVDRAKRDNLLEIRGE